MQDAGIDDMCTCAEDPGRGVGRMLLVPVEVVVAAVLLLLRGDMGAHIEKPLFLIPRSTPRSVVFTTGVTSRDAGTAGAAGRFPRGGIAAPSKAAPSWASKSSAAF